MNSKPTGVGNGNKPNGPARPPGSTNRPPGGPSRPVGTTGVAPKQPVRSGATGQPVLTRTQPQRTGFRVRPLDIALVAVGLVLVGALIWGGLNGAASKPVAVPAATVAANTTAVGAGSSTEQPQQRVPVEAGKPAPDFSLPATDGKTYTLSEFKGKKAVLLEFMAPWCPHCQADAPEFANVYNTFKDKDVQMFAVSATPRGKDNTSPITMEDLTWFRDKFSVPYPMLFDPALKSADNYGIEYYPTAYVIDKNGLVSGAHLISDGGDNPLDAKRMIAEVNKVLK